MPSASKASPPRPPTFPSVSYLLLNEKPDYLPRHIAAEVQRVDKEFQNHQVEMRLIQSLLSDQEYLETRDYQSITTRHLERVLVMSSIVRQRSIRTSQLYESAQKILNLRLSIKSADWSGIRCWLIELRDLAPEAEKEVSNLQKQHTLNSNYLIKSLYPQVSAVCAMSEANLTMHASLTQAMSQHRITGSYAKLDISQTNIVLLLSTLRAAESVPKLSADDRQVIYSAEKLKTVRLCILMADYAKLLREIEDIELRELADVAQDELFLVKRAIGFYTTLKNISNCLRTGHIVAAAGYAESRDVSLYVLNNAISSIDINDCSGSIEVYLKNAILIRDLRAAIKAGKWGSMELAELLLKSVRKNRETYEIRRKFSKYYTHHGDSSVIYASKSSNSKSHMKISRTPFQEQEIELYPTSSRRHSNSNISSAINMSDDSSDSEDDVENSLELQDEKAFHIATSLMNHSPHNLLNVDYGKIIFGRGDSDNPSSTGYGDRNVFMSPNSPSFGTFSYSDNMFRRQMSSTGDLNYKRSRLSPRKVGSPDKDNTMNVYRRSSSIAPSFLKSTPRKGSQSFSGMDLDKTLGAAMNYQPTGRTLGTPDCY